MPLTQYERHQGNLDRERVTREVTVNSSVVARGVSAPYEGASTPCVMETFKLNEPQLKYVFTDALTGCAGLIAVSGDPLPPPETFKAASALVIHDKGGDKLESSQKLLEDFIVAQHKMGHSQMRLIWGNGVIKEQVDLTHSHDTKRMVDRLANKYPHLEIKHLPKQMSLLVDNRGKPINLANTPLHSADMDVLCKMEPDLDISSLTDLNFNRPFQRRFVPSQQQVVASPLEQITDALHHGKFPPLGLMEANENMRVYLNNVTSKLGTDEQHYSSLVTKIKAYPHPMVQEIGAQLDKYKLAYNQYKWGSQNYNKAELSARKWWAMLFLATELQEALDGKPARSQLFTTEFYKTSVPRSMDGVASTIASSLVKKVHKEIDTQGIETLDGRKPQPEVRDKSISKQEETATYDSMKPNN